MPDFFSNPIFRIVGGAIVGGAIGFAYYKFIGCRTGTCPITQNPWTTTVYFGFLGILFTWKG